MSEPVQIVIISVVTVLTIVLALVGIQILFILKEIRQAIGKFNAMLDDTRSLTSRISHSTDSISGMFMGVKTAISLLGALKKEKKNDDAS